jgi:hypothetical protein
MKSLLVLLCVSLPPVFAQSTSIEVGAKPVGTRKTLNLDSGFGVLETCRDEGSANDRITCASSYNSALMSTHDSVHNNENFCRSTNGSAQYTCSLPYKVITAYQAGMSFVLAADATCSSSCSLNIDMLGPVSVKNSDGATDPAGALVAGEPQWVFYDGRVFRLMGGGRRRGGDDDDRQRDVMGRRFIASLETLTYAPLMMLETTAGDMHKTTTSNAIGNATIDAATGGLAGQHMWVIVVNDQISAKTITFGQHLKSAGTLIGTPGKAATLQFISDGSMWYEVARTTNL